MSEPKPIRAVVSVFILGREFEHVCEHPHISREEALECASAITAETQVLLSAGSKVLLGVPPEVSMLEAQAEAWREEVARDW